MRTLGFLLLVIAGCGACPSETPDEHDASPKRGGTPPESRASVPIPELAACRSLLDADEPPAREDVRRCDTAVFERCGDEARPDGSIRITTAMHACLAKYCPRLGKAQPDLCQGQDPVYANAGGDAEVTEDATEFLIAMLALVHDRDRADDSVRQVAILQARRFAYVFQAVHTPLPRWGAGEPGSDDLDLTVSITSEGFTVTGEGLVPLRIPADDPEDAAQGWDWAALEAEARGLQAGHPGVSTVTLQPAASISLDVLTRAIEAMRGSDCALPDDPSTCLFPDVIVDRTH